ncbi:malate dehydrogenase [Candidatus Methanosphaera massiliense]|uniref:malate dehydrogenase n=1 Tax=Methanosphaera TaxID=2316 RepID=UPI000DC5E870|nr:malate dehydrogenase [Candidatus Methanosphaera massiliense]MDD6286412.1 malate dehydrogenase [Methanobacteriaceae archaeon]MDE4078946.1 malate dehydrogenase [Candidatus Methanosphaera massiliense]RAP44903.1 MAG: malate dehydrogenase [Methanosphaera sp. SHI1033]
MVKVSIMGASGTIGKNVAFTLAEEDSIDEIVMFSRPSSIENVKGEILDIYDALAVEDIDSVLTPSTNYEDLKDSAIVLITSGIHRKEGMSRLDLAVPNAKIVKDYAEQIAKYAPDSIILIVTNPVDVMTTVALEASGFDKSRVIGLGNHLDSLRLKTILSKHFNINSGEIHTRVIGEHGDHMVPLLSSTTIGGILLKYFVESSDLDVPGLVTRLKSAGSTIISKKGATEYGPAHAIANLISTIVNDSRKILTVSTYLEGEVEGVYDVSLGVPVILCRNGIQAIVPLKMNDDERTEFFDAARTVKKVTYKVKKELEE